MKCIKSPLKYRKTLSLSIKDLELIASALRSHLSILEVCYAFDDRECLEDYRYILHKICEELNVFWDEWLCDSNHIKDF